MKLKIFHLWLLACITFALAMYMALTENLAGSIVFTGLCLTFLMSTRWASPDIEQGSG